MHRGQAQTCCEGGSCWFCRDRALREGPMGRSCCTGTGRNSSENWWAEHTFSPLTADTLLQMTMQALSKGIRL